MKTFNVFFLPDKKENFFIEDVDGQDAEAVEVLNGSRWSVPEKIKNLKVQLKKI